MKILVLNAGSSSLKYQLIDMNGENCVAKGICEKIGYADTKITHRVGDSKFVYREYLSNHKVAFHKVIDMLTKGEGKVIGSLSEVDAVGHRAVHGGEQIKDSVYVDDSVIEIIRQNSEFAPLHNPPEAVTIQTCRAMFGDKVPNVAVFDTAFHQTMPAEAYLFAIPYEYYEGQQIRRYGFHGTSHRYLSQHYYKVYGGDEHNSRLITCHLGNGSSVCAVKNGKSIDTSMGFTPLDGLIMGTRSGSVDPSVITYIMNKEHLSADKVNEMLNKNSGFLGISGTVYDHRDLYADESRGNSRATLALRMLEYQLKKYIGAYAAAMGGVDAVIFSGGIGENDPISRFNVCSNMEYIGLKVDMARSEAVNRKEGIFSTDDSRVKALVVPTNEELMIARDTLSIVLKMYA